MTTVEGRTRYALHDVADGLDVTEADIARMEADLLPALSGPRHVAGSRGFTPVRRRWGLAVAAVAVAAAVAGGLALSADEQDPARPAGAPPSSPPSSDQPLVPDDLIGTWQNVPDSPWVWEFTADGRIGVTETPGSYLEGNLETQVISRSGDVYTLRVQEEGCDETWRIRSAGPGRRAISFMTSTCRTTAPTEGDELHLERISPEPYLDGDLLATTTNPADAGRTYFIRSVWLHVETESVLVVGNPWGGSIGRYVLDDDGDGSTDPDQRGRVELPRNGLPVFRPDAGQGGDCPLAFTAVVVDRHRLTTTGPDGSCFPGVQVWVRIS